MIEMGYSDLKVRESGIPDVIRAQRYFMLNR